MASLPTRAVSVASSFAAAIALAGCNGGAGTSSFSSGGDGTIPLAQGAVPGTAPQSAVAPQGLTTPGVAPQSVAGPPGPTAIASAAPAASPAASGAGATSVATAGSDAALSAVRTVPAAATPATKSSKRGIAYDIAAQADLTALAPGVSWWYDWAAAPDPKLPAGAGARAGVEFDPMLWNGTFDAAAIEAYFKAHPADRYLLVLNEPNVSGQAYTTPQAAAQLWPRYEAVAAASHVALVGPAITWGTMPGYQDPVAWMDAFVAAYKSANGDRSPRIDYLAFHWYDYGLDAQLTRLQKYGKPFWVTEFANWHAQADGAQIDTLAKQQAQMTDMVKTCEGRADVFRYAWFTGRVSPDPHFDSLLGAPGRLTALGTTYLSLPHG